MKHYDVIVVGSGSGAVILDEALSGGLKVALVDKGPVGGTCLNLGCIPSKMLVFPADRVAEIQDSGKLGVNAIVKQADFGFIMRRMRKTVQEGSSGMSRWIKHAKNLDFYEAEAHFVGDCTLQAGSSRIKGDKIFIASGARPFIPKIKGLEKAGYLTNETVLELKKLPKSIIIIGGGYIAAEYAHFFAAMGSQVTILQKNRRLVPDEEPEISDLLKKEMQRRMSVYTGMEAVEVRAKKRGYAVIGKDVKAGREKSFSAEKVMVAAGRKSNADLLMAEKTGVETDSRGFIKTNRFLETTKKGIWAFGDAIGKKMFRHVANEEAVLAWQNSLGRKKTGMDYSAAPHAIFSFPQVASVGLTEKEAKKGHDVLVGTAKYSDVAKGAAMAEENSFAKAIVEKGTGKILGFHIIGPHAAVLIQEVVAVMANNLDAGAVFKAMHIHPALSELIPAALGNAE